MRIERLQAHGLMSYQEIDLAFPKRGIVLISGSNGSGKTSILEGIVYGLTGKPLRSAARGWHPLAGVSSEVTVTVDGKEIRRGQGTRAAKAPSWLGPPEAFLGGHVFSRELLETLSLATDSDRVRLLERAVGLDGFEAAGVAARQKLKDATRNEQEAARLVAMLQDQTQDLERLQPTGPKASLTALDGKAQEATQALRLASEQLTSTRSLHQEKRERWKHLEALGAKLSARETCEACGQKLPADARKAHQQRHTEYERLSPQVEDLAREIQRQEGVVVAYRQRVSDLATLRAETVSALEVRKTYETQHASLEKRRVAAQKAREGALLAQEVSGHLTEMFAARSALRTSLLGGAAQHLSVLARTELRKLSGPALDLGLALQGDRLVLSVPRQGKDESYVGCSTGERRRVDFALLMALGQLRERLAGDAPHWECYLFDEILDGLDGEGHEAVLERLETLGRGALVLLTSHSQKLSAELPSARHWHVLRAENGSRVEER